MAAFVLQQLSCIVETENIWRAKPRIYTIWQSTGRSLLIPDLE